MKDHSLLKKVGQLLVIGLPGKRLDPAFSEWFSRYPVGGVILYRRNIESVEQVKTLISELKRLASIKRPGEPFFVTVDQEGGNLSPLRGLVSSLPGSMALAATGDEEIAFQAGYRTGLEVGELGFNVDFAPVLDLGLQPENPVMGTRVFSDNPETVARFGRAFAKGLTQAGISFTAKHFPGHGDCREDSHVEVPLNTREKQVLLKRDLLPFRVVADLPGAGVMTAHVRYRDLDDKAPASLSQKVVTNLLRQELGFNGVSVTDDLEMGAISMYCSFSQAVVEAVKAGNDLLLVCHTKEKQEQALESLYQAVVDGTIPLQRIDESIERLRNWGVKGKPLPSEVSLTDLGTRALSLLGPSYRASSFPIALVVPKQDKATPADDASGIETLAKYLRGNGVPVTTIACEANPGVEEQNKVVKALEAHARVVMVLHNTFSFPQQITLAKSLAKDKEFLAVLIRDPRESQGLEKQCPILVTYSSEDCMLQAAAKMISGKEQAQGRIPLS